MTTPETPFLIDFFAALKERGVRYAVMRNSETLPESLGGSDLDILVEHTDFDIAVHCALVSARKHNGELIVNRRILKFSQLMFLGMEDGCWWGICIDLFDGVSYHGFLSVCADDVLAYRVFNEKGFWTFDDEVAHLIGFAKEWLVNGSLSTRYVTLAKKASEKGRLLVLSPTVAKVIATILDGQCVSLRFFRFIQVVNAVVVKPKLFLKDYCSYQFGKLYRFLRPSGSMIVVLGTDGSGKTTLLNDIVPVLNQTMHGQLIVHHLKPDLLPPLGRLRGVKYKPGYICSSPHASTPSGTIGSIIRIIYLTIDYILGYWIKIRYHLSKIPTGSWLFDRYAYDLLIDPLRFRVRLPKRIISFFINFVPKPDLILCLGGDPEKIYARKPETNLVEVRRQMEELKMFCQGNPRAVWIDTTREIDECKDAALTAIVKTMAENYK